MVLSYLGVKSGIAAIQRSEKSPEAKIENGAREYAGGRKDGLDPDVIIVKYQSRPKDEHSVKWPVPDAGVFSGLELLFYPGPTGTVFWLLLPE
ncbi:hypothetical protein [Flavilitoribacter nigricans]|uniref:hypothetical protein n=1 Tax=Flavilitoribacter nigricans TaxID=70997 RepID=UPI001179A425|nr:hypothetical protein [Flavilitoribacter nigricans]